MNSRQGFSVLAVLLVSVGFTVLQANKVVLPGKNLWIITSIIADKSCSTLDKSCSTLDKVCSILDQVSDMQLCAPIPITEPTIISDSGSYCVANQIIGLIDIQASQVFLDLNGQVVENLAATNVNEVLIHDGVLNPQSGEIGLDVVGSSNIKVQNVDFFSEISDEPALRAQSSVCLDVERCVFRDFTTTGTLVDLIGVTNARIEECRFCNVETEPVANVVLGSIIGIDQSAGVTISNTSIKGSFFERGINIVDTSFSDNSSGIKVLNCQITNNSAPVGGPGNLSAIITRNSSGVVIDSNCILSNLALSTGIFGGIDVLASTSFSCVRNNIIKDNSSEAGGFSGILIAASTTNITIDENLVSDGQGFGVLSTGTSAAIFNNKAQGHATNFDIFGPVVVFDMSTGSFASVPSHFDNIDIVA